MTFLFVSNIMTGGLDDETRLLLHQIIQGNITKVKIDLSARKSPCASFLIIYGVTF